VASHGQTVASHALFVELLQAVASHGQARLYTAKHGFGTGRVIFSFVVENINLMHNDIPIQTVASHGQARLYTAKHGFGTGWSVSHVLSKSTII